jgi:hypothetical protein
MDLVLYHFHGVDEHVGEVHRQHDASSQVRSPLASSPQRPSGSTKEVVGELSIVSTMMDAKNVAMAEKLLNNGDAKRQTETSGLSALEGLNVGTPQLAENPQASHIWPF